MSLDIETLRTSFELVAERCPNVIDLFYDELFARYPQAQRLFGRNPKRVQAQMLTEMLASVLDKLEDASWLERNLKALGAKHVGYGVRDDMYPWVGECLLVALSKAAGDAWTPKVAGAWTDAYGAISGLMLQGAAEARAEGSASEIPRAVA